MRSQRVSSGVGAVACSAAIRACTTYDAASAVSGPARPGCPQQPGRLGDLVVVPAGAVLVGEEHQATVAHACVAPGVLEQHQGEQGDECRLVGTQAEHDPHQADRLAGQVGAQQVGSGAGGVAGREGEVGGLRDDVEAVRQHRRVRDGERDARADDALLGPGDPRRHGRLGHQEEPGDVDRRHAHHQAEGQRARRLRRECGVGAHQHQAQDVVLDEAAAVGHRAGALLVAFDVGEEQGQLAPRDLLGAQPVEHPATRGRHQPAGRVVGHAVVRPGAARRLDGVAERVLDQVEPTELRQEQGHEPAPLLSHDLLEVVACWLRASRPRSGGSGCRRAGAPSAARRPRRGRVPRAGRNRPCPR